MRGTSKPIVLIAADDRGLRRLVHTTIRSQEYDLVETTDERSAWSNIVERRPSVVLLDANLPGRGGLELTRAIRRDPEFKASRVILFMDRADPAMIEACFDAGADHCLVKPISPRELLIAVRSGVAGAEARARVGASAPTESAEAARARRNMRLAYAFLVSEHGQSPEASDPHMARVLAEAQQLRAVQDFRAAHEEACRLAEQLERAYAETITAMAKAVEARDQYTGSHVERVGRYSDRIAERLGLEPDTRKMLEFGAVLHDVGKIGVPDAVLTKPGPLALDEWRIMQRHPEIGKGMLAGVGFLTPALDAVACHHERWDGRGYPFGLSRDQIPLAGRIVAVADAFDAMTTSRPYRDRLPIEHALDEITRARGAGFDPEVVDAFLAVVPTAA